MPVAVSKLPFKHILVVAPPAWGHLRPLVSLSCKLIQQRPDITITFPTVGDFNNKVENEIKSHFYEEDSRDLKNNIRLLHLGEFGASGLVELFNRFCKTFNNIYPAIYEERPVRCLTGETYPAITRPDVILLDPHLLPILREIRKVSGDNIPVLAWNSASLPATLRFFGPESLGGLGNIAQKAEEISQVTGKPSFEILQDLCAPQAGEVIKLPGLPAMYDYEFNDRHIDSTLARFRGEVIFKNDYIFFQECDGIVAAGSTALEPEIYAAYRTWFAPRPVYFIGPLIPDQTSHSQEKDLPNGCSNDSEILNFLNAIQKSHGDYSLLYISFGSVFWPLGETVWKLLELVLDVKMPLILSLNSRIEIPAHLRTKVKASELVLISAWAPQHAILSHRATGFFLTHCGNSSITEAMSHGVPMIAWPLAGDQYTNAAYISSTLNIAYELFETRFNDGLPLCRGVKPIGTVEAATEELLSVLVRAWGKDGIRKRENIRVLQKKVNSTWNKDGEARRELRYFLDKFVPLD